MNEKKPINLKGRTDLADLNALVFKAVRDGFAAGKVWLDGPQRHAMCLAMKVEHGFVEVYTAERQANPPENSRATPEEVRARALCSIFENRYSSPRLCTVSPSGEVLDARPFDGFDIRAETVPQIPLVDYGLGLLADTIRECHDQELYEAAMSHPKAEEWREEFYCDLRHRRKETFSALFHGEAYTTVSEVPVDADFLKPGTMYPHVLLGLDERSLAMRAIESPTLTARDSVDDILGSARALALLADKIAREIARQQVFADAQRDPALLEEVDRAHAIYAAIETFRGNVNMWVEVPTRGDGLRFQMHVEDLRRALSAGVLDPWAVTKAADAFAVSDAVNAGGDIRIGEISSLTYSRKTYWKADPLDHREPEKEEPETPAHDGHEPTWAAPSVAAHDGRTNDEEER